MIHCHLPAITPEELHDMERFNPKVLPTSNASATSTTS
jgi:hypothetical protein